MSMGLFSAFSNRGGEYDKETHLKQLTALKEAKPKIYYIGIGKDDFLYQSTVNLRAIYDEIGLKYIYRESEGTHDWNSWRLYLKEFLPMCFK